MVDGKLSEKASRRFDTAALAAISRTFAREAVMRVAQEGLKWTVGAGGEAPALNWAAIHRAQIGLVADMDFVADGLYGRAAKAARVA